MKTLRTAAIALALTAAAAVASIPSVNAGNKTVKGKVVQASAPVPTCAPGTSDCGMFSR